MFILILCETYSGHEQIDENLVRTPNVYQITSPSSARLYIPSEQTIFTPPLYEQTTRVFFDRFFFNLMFILWFVDDFFSKSFSSHGIHGIIWRCKCFGSRWMVLVGSWVSPSEKCGSRRTNTCTKRRPIRHLSRLSSPDTRKVLFWMRRLFSFAKACLRAISRLDFFETSNFLWNVLLTNC